MYDYKIIEQELKTNYFGRTFIQFEKINSVHKKAKNISVNCPNGMVILTECQDNINLKYKKIWNSNIMNSIYMSVIIKNYDKNNKNFINYILQIANASICNTINDLYDGIDCKIKWPNDLLINNKKVCSVFVEEVNKKDFSCIICSLYLNLSSIYKSCDNNKTNDSNNNEINNDDFEDAVLKNNELNNTKENEEDNRISLHDILKIDVNREYLVAKILNSLELLYESLLKVEDLSLALEIIKTKNVILNKHIGLRKYNKKTVKNYKVIDINNYGEIVVIDENNNEKILKLGQDVIEWWTDDKET